MASNERLRPLIDIVGVGEDDGIEDPLEKSRPFPLRREAQRAPKARYLMEVLEFILMWVDSSTGYGNKLLSIQALRKQ
ncbi:hypothetical protein N7449_012245 [Penicillium cf. viridicatum]|uniref:Uncharacterized protein n=1 Tax=Penicillium cf. viridicatum TaxID=2972119 RepID=A0A9W9IN13_9EURO|nr:hypothetical protein N7449_012245 [Penicillium cf. viridicatum]